MGIFDDIANALTPSSDDPSEMISSDQLPVESSAPAQAAYSSSQMLSPSYSIASLSQTNYGLSRPNLPTTQDQVDNMTILANILDQLTSNIGQFSIISGFRIPELQAALAAAGDPVATGTSFHELGRAVDIAPTGMTPAEFFGRLLANENLKNMFAEIAIKPSQNTIHLAVNVPSDTRTPKVLGLNSDNIYASLSLNDILTYIEPYMPSLQAATDYADAQLVTRSSLPVILGAILAIGFGIMALSSKKRSASS